MLSETRSRIATGRPINQKYIKSRLSMLFNFIPRCCNAEQVIDMKEEQRLLRKYKKEVYK